MQARIEEHPDFSTKIEDDPIELLEALKTLMHDTVRAQYPLMSMTDALTRLVNIKQMDTESLLDYVKRFKQQRDVAKSQIGKHILDKFVEQSEEYRNTTDAQEQTDMKSEAFEKWMAYLLMKGSDYTKYGSLIKGFVSQFSLGNDQYSKTITTAIDVLSNHKIDPKYYDNQKQNRERQRTERENEARE
jgi:hypothetical protein